MRKILLLLVFTASIFTADAQYTRINAYGYNWLRGKFDSTLSLPADTLASSPNASLAVKNDTMYVKVSGFWRSLGASGSFLNNQYASQQTARAWIDTLKAYQLSFTNSFSGTLATKGLIELPSYRDGRDNSGLTFNNRLRAEGLTVPGMAGFYSTVGGGSGNIRIVRYYREDFNDTNSVQYDGPLYIYNEQVISETSSRYDSAQRGKLFLQNAGGVYNVSKIYPGRNLKWAVRSFGYSGSNHHATLSFGNTDSALKITWIPTSEHPIPLSVYNSDIDFDRDLKGKKRTYQGGLGITGFLAHWKNRQSGPINFSASSVARVTDFYSRGSLYLDPYGGYTKTQITNDSRVDTAIGFYSYPKYTALNEVVNGYGFVQDGSLDVNVFQGRTYVGYPWWITKAAADSNTNVSLSSYGVIQYGRNLGSLYTSRSLVDRGYVDSVATTLAPSSGVTTLTDGATITWNVSTVKSATVTLGGNRTLSITGATAGTYGTIKLVQDATGSRTITLPAGSKVVNAGAGAVTLTTTAAAIDIMTFFYDGTNYFWTIGKNFN